VPHVHVHIIPRHAGDLKEDEIYRLLESEDADLEKVFRQQEDGNRKSRFPVTEEEKRRPRSEEEMAADAEWLRRKMEELE
jgi:bis(5'-adenosyl)-triphosphatase